MVKLGTCSFIVLVLMVLTNVSSVLAQSVRAFVDRNPISVDETVRLVVEQQGQSTGDAPDLSPLEKDFDVLGNSQSSQTSIINGRTSTSKQWVITLAPKHAGNATIPPIAVGRESSKPLVLRVQQPSQGEQGSAGKDIFLEATVEPKDPYVQSQILYTLRLYHAVQLREGRIEDPQINAAVVERVGEDHSFETIRDGRRYQVIERRYLVVPQASGSLKIPSVLFSGKVPDVRRSRSMFEDMFGNRSGVFGGGFQSARLVRARSPEITLKVQEIPLGMKSSAWLPARELSLTEKWSTDSLDVRVGEPITRTITIHAKGLTGEQLPELSFSEEAGVKIYPDQPTITTTFDGSWAVGTREQKLALVPTQPGDVTIPETRVRWWNLKTHRPEEAVLPARSLTILDSSASSNGPDVSPDQGTMALQDSTSPSSTTVASTPIQKDSDNSLASWLAQWPFMAVIFLVIWLLTVAGWCYDRNKLLKERNPLNTHDKEQARRSLRAVRDLVKKACLENSPNQAREALQKWASVAWGGGLHRNLGSIAKKFTLPDQSQSDAQQAIWDLDRTLYAEQHNEWDGKKFWNIIAPEMRSLETSNGATGTKDEEALPSLYLHARSS